MILRRYYNRNVKYRYYFHPEIKTYHEFHAFADANKDINCWSLDNAEYCPVFTKEEQDSRWTDCIKLIMKDTRYVLDNLDDMMTFDVRWNSYKYHARDAVIGLPPVYLTQYCDKMYNWIY